MSLAARAALAVSLIVAPVLASGLVGCDQPHAPAAADPKAATPTAKTPVHVVIDLPRASFADGDVTISVWSQAELARRDRMSGCVVSWDGKTEQTICPAGVTFEASKPETFTFSAAELAHPVAFDATTIALGERYEISIGGRASDGCNSIGGDARGVLSSTTLALKDLQLAQTDMACVPAP